MLKSAEGISNFITMNLKEMFAKSIMNKFAYKIIEKIIIKNILLKVMAHTIKAKLHNANITEDTRMNAVDTSKAFGHIFMNVKMVDGLIKVDGLATNQLNNVNQLTKQLRNSII